MLRVHPSPLQPLKVVLEADIDPEVGRLEIVLHRDLCKVKENVHRMGGERPSGVEPWLSTPVHSALKFMSGLKLQPRN